MRKLLLSTFLLLTAPALALAAPALEDYLTFHQPDGTTFIARKRGDEYQNWVETESGHTVVRNRATGDWEYATQSAGGYLQPSGQRVVSSRKIPAGVPTQLRPPRNIDAERIQSRVMRKMYLQRLPMIAAPAAGQGDAALSFGVGDWVPVPLSGTRNVIVILVNFTDRTLSTAPAGWGSAVFSTTAGAKTVANYYRDNSFNSLLVNPVTHTQEGSPPGVVTVSVPWPHPDNGTPEDFWVTAAIDAADPHVHFALLDTNGNGSVDRSEAVVYLIPAGYEETATHKTPSVWAHARWNLLYAAGVTFPVYAMSGELNNDSEQLPIGVITHELGHQFCGLPDLYDTSGRNQGLGQFSLMASGSWGSDAGEDSGTTPVNLDAWSREYLGWAAPLVPVSPSTLSLAHPLSAQDAAYKLITPAASGTEYFLLENRQPVGWDRGLRGGYAGFGSDWAGGLLLTHIDLTAGTAGYNNINSYSNDAGHQGVIPVQASTATCDMLAFGSTCRGSGTTLYYAGNNTSWTPITAPDSNYHNGNTSSFNLLNISAPAAVMTADYAFITPQYRNISVARTGSGSVNSSPGGIACGSSCSATFAVGSKVTLKAVPEPGFRLVSWSGGNCSGTGPCLITVESDTLVTAEFGPSATVDIDSTEVPRPIYDNFTATSSLEVPPGVCSRLADVNVRIDITHSWIGELTISLAHTESGRSSDLFRQSCSSHDYIDAWFNDEAATILECPPSGSYPPVSALSVFDGLDPTGTWTLNVTDGGTFDTGLIRGWGISFSCQNTLSVSVAGNGAGTVISDPQGVDPQGIVCSAGPCSTYFTGDASVELLNAADIYSTFAGWSGSCSGPGACSVTMNLPRSVSASFVSAPLVVNRESGQSFSSLRDAYAAAGNGNTLRARIGSSPLQEGPMLFDRGIEISVRGGFDAEYTLNEGYTAIKGTLTVRGGLSNAGSLTVERLLLRPAP